MVARTHRHALLYDTGPRYTDEADAGGRIVAPFLRAAGIARLTGMVVTLAVVYRPRWVTTFDDARYLDGR